MSLIWRIVIICIGKLNMVYDRAGIRLFSSCADISLTRFQH